MKGTKVPKGFPEKVLVYGQKWRIVYIDGLVSEKNLFGMTDNPQRMVLIDAEQSKESMRDTLLHELLHCIFVCSGSRFKKASEEKVVRIITPGLLDLFRNNRGLKKCLGL